MILLVYFVVHPPPPNLLSIHLEYFASDPLSHELSYDCGLFAGSIKELGVSRIKMGCESIRDSRLFFLRSSGDAWWPQEWGNLVCFFLVLGEGLGWTR